MDVNTILRAVQAESGLPISAICGNDRYHTYAEPRHMAMLLIDELTSTTRETQGDLFGCTHSNVTRSIASVKGIVNNNRKWALRYKSIKENL
jgi:chromosomal replication initiation ATPase DnaA